MNAHELAAWLCKRTKTIFVRQHGHATHLDRWATVEATEDVFRFTETTSGRSELLDLDRLGRVVDLMDEAAACGDVSTLSRPLG